jgi:hypothetical protein
VITVRIDIGGDDGELYWTLPANLSAWYDSLPEEVQALVTISIQPLIRMFVLNISGALLTADIGGLEQLHQTLRTHAEAAITRLRKSAP